MALFRTHLPLKALRAAVVVGVGLALAGAAQQQQEPPQLSEYANDQVNQSLRPALDAKDWAKALGVIDTVLAKVSPDSYDAALLHQIRAQTCLQKSDFRGALAGLERCLEISDRHSNYFTEKVLLETVYNIAQLNYQEGATVKDPKLQMEHFARTQTAIERWLKATDPQSYTQDNIQFIASVFFTLGQGIESGGEQKTDMAMMEKALSWIDRGLTSAVHPRDVFYQLKISALFQLNRLEEGHDYLELRLKEKPENKSYWQQLAFTYIQLANMASEKHDDPAAYRYNVRAVLTFDRAQKLGFLNSPKDNFNLVGIYFAINQYNRACELLDTGLRNGGIESTLQNWQLLAYSYQEQHEDMKAIHLLEDAAKVFPHSGPIEYQIAQIYSGIDRPKEALEHIKLCVANGGTEKPHVGWLFYAWLAYDLKKYDDAMKAAQEAAKYPEAAKEAARMQEAIRASLQEQDNRLTPPQAR
jgi:tetratricopeptide (TPR) repeat protein